MSTLTVRFTVCPKCESPMTPRFDGTMFYRCTQGDCDGTRKAATDGRPLGQDRREPGLKQAKHEAHQAFDRLWQVGRIEDRYALRTLAYRWLSVMLDIPVARCHISYFDLATYRRVVDLCQNMNRASLKAWMREHKRSESTCM
jgi:hypothetical protein